MSQYILIYSRPTASAKWIQRIFVCEDTIPSHHLSPKFHSVVQHVKSNSRLPRQTRTTSILLNFVRRKLDWVEELRAFLRSFPKDGSLNIRLCLCRGRVLHKFRAKSIQGWAVKHDPAWEWMARSERTYGMNSQVSAMHWGRAGATGAKKRT